MSKEKQTEEQSDKVVTRYDRKWKRERKRRKRNADPGSVLK